MVAHRRIDDDRSASMTVVESLAEARGVSPLDFDGPLYEVVDPDTLDTLFESQDGLTAGLITFAAGGAEVIVTADRDVYVTVH